MKMKNSSIRKRVTSYYSVVLIIITILMVSVFLLTANRQIHIVSKDTVMNAVQNSFEDIEYENQVLEIDNDFDSYHKGVILLIYSEEGRLIKGSVPSGFESSTPLSHGTYQELEDGETTWLFYDLFNAYDNGQGIWVRGIYDMDSTLRTLHAVRSFMFFFLPFMVLVAIGAGIRITGKALAPVSQITQAANSINSGTDLSKRLPQGEVKDELYYLTETLNQMMGRLEEAFKAEKQFSSDVSHELKTPLSVILAECEYTMKENRTAEEYRESIETIQQQCARTMSMIQQLLQISRTISAEKFISREEINLSLLCESIADELSLLAEEKHVTLQTAISPDIEICADETLIMRMILNLITNGIKYHRNIPGAYVKLSLYKDTDIYIIVEDNGIGIKKEHLSDIFNRFYRVDKARTSSDNSFGLGLPMVKWIAESHGGSVCAESIYGIGSRFLVKLPA